MLGDSTRSFWEVVNKAGELWIRVNVWFWGGQFFDGGIYSEDLVSKTKSQTIRRGDKFKDLIWCPDNWEGSVFKCPFSNHFLFSLGSKGNTRRSEAIKRLLALIVVALRLSQLEYL